MNDLLSLSGEFQSKTPDRYSTSTLPKGVTVTATELTKLANDLKLCLGSWQGSKLVSGILIEVRYKRIIAKSNRIKRLLTQGGRDPEESIRTARYETTCTGKPRHIMVHYVPIKAVQTTIAELATAAELTGRKYVNGIGSEAIEALQKKEFTREQWKKHYSEEIARTSYLKLIHDAAFVESLAIPQATAERRGETLVTFYRTERSAKDILKDLGISIIEANTLDNVALLQADQYQTLSERAPYLVAMTCHDLNKMHELPSQPEPDIASPVLRELPPPSNEPIIGVIDTPFEEDSPPYFSKWVESENHLSSDIPLTAKDYKHGTSVSSLIVDGPGLNPELEDGCGHFRVKHFGVATAQGFSSFNIVKRIDRIVADNPDIKVWNLSLGSTSETEPHSISPEAAAIDRIQKKYGVLFVVAGTNKKGDAVRIGAPADSVNALVVNAVRKDGTAASYTRRGPVLEFFRKPDIAYYGGDKDEPLCVCFGTRLAKEYGTSLATPLIARKAAYLIYQMGLSRDVAKALLIDSARGWSRGIISDETGYGIVPIHIEKLLQVPDNEIRFFISGTATAYETYNYALPVPHVQGHYPYEARAVLTYCPSCTRDQGVDYTNTELDLHLGRLKDGRIDPLNRNFQGEPGCKIYEEDARKTLRKWDNVKYVTNATSERPKPKKVYSNPDWGIKIRKTTRFSSWNALSREPQPFGLVVTLREITGANRIEGFIQQCFAHGWFVNRVSIKNRVRVYESSQVEIEFE